MGGDPATDAVAMSEISKDSLDEGKYREEALGANRLAGEYPSSKRVERYGKGILSLQLSHLANVEAVIWHGMVVMHETAPAAVSSLNHRL